MPFVVADAGVILKWFHAEGEEEVVPARAILEAFARRKIDLVTLDLAIYEIGTVLMTVGASPRGTATVLNALTEVCHPVALSGIERATAARLAGQHDLCFRDAAYAAVAQEGHGQLVTMRHELLRARLGVRPEDFVRADDLEFRLFAYSW
jgi:predicted nucleic acid-binding protein